MGYGSLGPQVGNSEDLKHAIERAKHSPGLIQHVSTAGNDASTPVMSHFNEILESSARLDRLIDSLATRLAPFCSASENGATMAAPAPPTVRPDSQFEFALLELNTRIQAAGARVATLLDTMRI